MTYKNFSKGFTLIELLLVIAIIGIVSALVITSLATARARARDVRRISDLKQMLNFVAQLGETVNFTGCVTSGVRATTCTPTPNLSSFVDPSSSTVCAPASAIPCDYRVIRRVGGVVGFGPPPVANNYEICVYLEQGSDVLTTGMVKIGDNTNLRIIQGSCAL